MVLANSRHFFPEPNEFQVEKVAIRTSAFVGVADSGEFRRLALILPNLDPLRTDLKFARVRLTSLKGIELITASEPQFFTTAVVLEVDQDYEQAFVQIATEILMLVELGGGSLEVERIVRSWAVLMLSNEPVSNKEITGLWGELLFLTSFNDISFGLKSWHIEHSDRWDFVVAEGLPVEIKTSLGPRRIHHFSSNQLNGNIPSELTIGSFLTIPAENGTSVRDLIELIREAVPATEFAEFIGKISHICSPFSEKLDRLKFDKKLAIQGANFFAASSIPVLDISYPVVSANWEVDFEGMASALLPSVQDVLTNVCAEGFFANS